MAEAVHIEDLADRIRPTAASRVLLWSIVLFTLFFIIWAAATRLDRVSRAQGRVIPSSQLQVMSNLEGGLVAEILVKPGQKVKAGDPLIRLDPTQLGADYGRTRANYDALSAKIARLQAEVEGRPPEFPATLSTNGASQIAAERAVYEARLAERRGLESGAEARLSQARRSLAEAKAMGAARKIANQSAQAQLKSVRALVESGIEPRMALMQTESEAAMAAGAAAAANEAVSRAASAITEAQSELIRAREDWRSQAAQELAAAQAQMVAERRLLPALADRVRRTTLRAPVDGTVNRVLVSTVGGSVLAGDPLVEVVPSEDSLIIEAAVSPTDIGAIRLNQPAKVKITAYDYAIYGGLDGHVISISPDAVVDPRTGQSFYQIRVKTDQTAILGDKGRKLPIGPGMVAEVDILGAKRSVLSYILTPLSRIRDSALRE